MTDDLLRRVLRLAPTLCLAAMVPGCLLPEGVRDAPPAAKDAPWPELEPLGPVLSGTAGLQTAQDPLQAEQARAADLRRRAEALRKLDTSEGL